MLDAAQAAVRPRAEEHLAGLGRSFRRLWPYLAFAVALVLLARLKDARPADAQVDYNAARQLFLRGNLKASQDQAERGYTQFRNSDPDLALKFQLLEAEAMLWRGMFGDALRLLALYPSDSRDQEGLVRKLAIESVALVHQPNLALANQDLSQAENICRSAPIAPCGEVLRARGVLSIAQGELSEARESFIEGLHFAEVHRDPWLEAGILLNLGGLALREEHFDEALDWSRSAYRIASDLGAEDVAQVASGNLGWAYLRLGDTERSLELFLQAAKRAEELGDISSRINWLSTAGNVYIEAGDISRAAQSYRQAFNLAQQIDSRQDIVDSLENLAFLSIDTGQPDEAASYLAKVTPLIQAGNDLLDQLDVMLAQGEIAALHRQDQRAKDLFHVVETDSVSQTSMRLGAEHELARLFESENNSEDAEKAYRKALTTFESARSELKQEDSKLPFLTNATPLYDDYIHFLVSHGRNREALMLADSSRARALAQGLGITPGATQLNVVAMGPERIARERHATLLFYWLGANQSYLWAITPQTTALFTLPSQSQLNTMIERYRRALTGPEDPIASSNEDGVALYNILLAPASGLIQSGIPVITIADGQLSQLNFETLLVPGPGPRSQSFQRRAAFHYWIDDVTVISAPSLSMLEAKEPAPSKENKLLLMGDANSPGPDYPTLPMAALEMQKIARHFSPADEDILARDKAVPEAYLSNTSNHYSYIHFVTHGVASRTDPLDSAIILSREGGAEDSFKLYARDIIRRPIQARLVTISACYSSGARSYAGEGLVGLSWAFLRAGAHNVIGALWEASDDSTPQLMDGLYQGLQSGQAPAEALRSAKLSLLHSESSFRKPFYWAPFQIYTGR
jgi:CHAT domain-containing protein